MASTILFATTNAHKTAEVQDILGPQWIVENLRAHPHLPVPDETGDTFEANAIIKALAASLAIPDCLVLADDSGLEVDALGGAPGVWSARYAGPGASDADNRARLKTELAALSTAPGTRFPGRFRCCLALARSGEVLCTHSASVEGALLLEEQGSGGFGYDSLFVPGGHSDSFGVLPSSVKNQLSHRARALASLVAWLSRSGSLL
jgi:XTP/dITP diphosphohydrolase